MNKEKHVQVNVRPNIRQELKIEAAKQNKTILDLVDEVWKFYKKSKKIGK